MPRPPRHGEPATEVIKIRLTKTLKAKVDAQRGDTDVSTWLRALITARVSPGETTDMIAGPPPMPPGDDPRSGDPVPGKHRHRRGDFISEINLKGTTRRTYRCAEPGCGKELTS